jgi:chemotaxis protein MotA
MDITTVLGVVGTFFLIGVGIWKRELTGIFLNLHGVLVVIGGTLIATLLNTPSHYMRGALGAVLGLFVEPRFSKPAEIIPVMVQLSQQARTRGLSALGEVDPRIADGFLRKACQIALEHNDPKFVRRVLEDEINQAADFQNEITNVLRTMGIFSPMFGLVGTLIGIVQVLRDLTNPEQVGPAMAVAITSAFYGILFANLVCVPAAGKLRIRSWEELRAKSLVLEGVVEIMNGAIPMLVERRLAALIEQPSEPPPAAPQQAGR